MLDLVQSCATMLQVEFIVRTHDWRDLRFLDTMLDRHPGVYSRHYVSSAPAGEWSAMYESLLDNQLYVKIDDDIVFIKVSLQRFKHHKLA